MGVSVRPRHVKRYKDVAVLLARHHDLTSSPEELANDLERLGPTFVKLGQLLSTRSDLLPPEYIAALSRLQDDVTPFGFADVERIVEAELRVRMSRAFSDFDNVPLASASLGQVHRAVLRDGRQVAVKVQRPGITERVLDDLDALGEMAAVVDAHTAAGRRYGFAAMFEEFRRSMLRELDYVQEAANLRTLRANLESFPRIVVPAPVADYTTSRVLTMDFVGGRKLTALGPLAQLEVDGTALADQLVAAYLQQILVDGFFHADPHPGNVFLTDGGDLALIDLGMVGRVRGELRGQLVKLLLAVGEGRGEEAARVLRSLAERADDEVDETAFRRAVGEVVLEQQGVVLADLRAGAVLLDLARVSADSGLRAPPELTMLGRALMALDEVTRTLDPAYDPNAAVRRQAADIVRRHVGDGASPGNVFASVLEAKEFVERLPRRVNALLDALAEGELKLTVRGVDERAIVSGVTSMANRITTGLVIAALIVGAAMLMRVPTRTTLFGYPALAIVCFLVAGAFGVALLVSIWWGGRTRR